MSESYRVQAAVYDRMVELEQKPAIDMMQILNDPSGMRGLLLTYTEKILTLQAAIQITQPKADAFDRIATSEGLLNITLTAKTLQMQPCKLFSWMQQQRWIYKRMGGKTWVAYQDRIQSGLLQHKITTITRSDGSEKIVEQVLVTPKGLAKLSGAISACNGFYNQTPVFGGAHQSH